MFGVVSLKPPLFNERSKIMLSSKEKYISSRVVRQRTRQVTKLERVELPEDRRKDYASIETLKASVDITMSYRRKRS
jgi:hypothetical protein